MDGGAWKAAVHGVAEGPTRLSDFTFTFHFHALEKEMATHSSALAWRIPGTGEPGGLPSIGSHSIGHDWSDLAVRHHGLQRLRLPCPSFLPVHFSSVSQSCPTLCDPMNHSTLGLPVLHQLLEFTPTHVHWVGDAIQPSHPLFSPSPSVFNLSQHRGLFEWVSSSHQVAKILGVSASTSVFPVNTQDWSPLGWTGYRDCSNSCPLSQYAI